MAVNNLARKESPEECLTFGDALKVLSREERFMGMVSAMNTMLIKKGIYTKEEIEGYYCQWAQAQLDRPKEERPGHN
jgi:hypothetical protein